MELEVFRESFVPPKFIDWRDACARLEKIRHYLREQLAQETAIAFLPARCFYIALLGELLVLRAINDNKLSCPVPWRENIGFVSLPTFSADAGKSAEFVGENGALKAIFQSFCGWRVFAKEIKEGCLCGLDAFKIMKGIEKSVVYEIWINHAITHAQGNILIKQFFAIKSEDAKFRNEHFSNKNGKLRNPSNVLADTNIVWVAENKIAISADSVKLSGTKPDCAQEIYDHSKPGDSFSCGEKILWLTKEMEEIYERSK